MTRFLIRFSAFLPVFLAVVLPLRAQDLETIDEAAPFTLTGSVSATVSGSVRSGGGEARYDPSAWTLSGSMTPTVYTVQLPFSFLLSSYDRSITQPFNQFGMSPSYKSLRGHFGYRSMSMSRYTLQGITFLGAGLEFNPGLIEVQGMVGRLQRAVEEDTTRLAVAPAYERWGQAVKVAFGDEVTRFEASWFHAKDDTASLRRPFLKADIAPQENTAFGGLLRFGIVDGVSVEAEGGASIVTANLRSGSVDLGSTSVPKVIGDIHDVRSSSRLNLAGRAAISYRGDGYGLQLGYEYVEPEFQSLGGNTFTTDVANLTIAPNVSLLEGQIQLSGSVGLQHDNLLGTRIARTNRVIGSLNASYNTETFGVSANYSNFSVDQQAGRAPVNDSIRARSVTQSAQLVPRLTLSNEETSQSYSLLGGVQDYTDLNANTAQLTSNRSFTGGIVYSLALLKSRMSAGASLTGTAVETAGGSTTTTLSGSLSGGMTMLEQDALNLNAALTASRTTATGIAGASLTFGATLGAGWRATTLDNLTASVALTSSTSGAGLPGFTDLSGSLTYTRSFSIFE